MSGKPQEVRIDEQERLIEQIITQGLDQIKAQAETVTLEAHESKASPASEQEGGGKPAPPSGGKNRRSAVYLYLLVLFGAAFLMLLLAYFVQRRSSEDAISGLRDSMNLSREELLNEIRELEEANAALEGQNGALGVELDRLNGELTHYQELYENRDYAARQFLNENLDMQKQLHSWETFWALEEAYRAENYEKCAQILLDQLDDYSSTYRAPENVRERYDEIVRAVIDKGILDEDYAQRPDDHSRPPDLDW